jgi:hypothetical protein
MRSKARRSIIRTPPKKPLVKKNFEAVIGAHYPVRLGLKVSGVFKIVAISAAARRRAIGASAT